MKIVVFGWLALFAVAFGTLLPSSEVKLSEDEIKDLETKGRELYQSYLDWKTSLSEGNDDTFLTFLNWIKTERSMQEIKAEKERQQEATKENENDYSAEDRNRKLDDNVKVEIADEESVEGRRSLYDEESQPESVFSDEEQVAKEDTDFIPKVLEPKDNLVLPQHLPRTSTCKTIKNANRNARSGFYSITVNGDTVVQVYCEMGLNGGGYTFLTPDVLTSLTNAQVQSMFTDRSSFLLRVRKTDGTQPYAVLKQLSEYASIPLKLGLNDYTSYNAPINVNAVGQPYLYFGFLPQRHAQNNNVQGLQVNSFRNTFSNCDKNPNSHFTLFANFKEFPTSTSNVPGPFCDRIWSHLLPNPSGRVMPPEIFMFGETHWGGCGCYQQTNRIPTILSFAIGFR